MLAVGLAKGMAQSEITEPINIQLVPALLEGGVYKYGIYASMAGSTTPQLYELDTGGAGFYPVFSTNAPYTTAAWGTNYTIVQPGISIGYASDNVYYGNAVATAISVYSADGSGGYQSTPALTSGNSVVVGQTLSITNTQGKTNSGQWPSTTPPVDQHFYGDFGLSLQYATNGIMNVLSQLNYSTNVIPGFVVKLGTTPGSTNAAIQVGLDKNYLSDYPIQIKIQGMNTNQLFPTAQGGTNGLPTYSGAVLLASMILNDATSGAYTNTDTPVILDTGASGTLFLSSETDGALTNYYTLDERGTGALNNGVQLTLVTQTTDNSTLDIFSATTGLGSNPFELAVTVRSNFALNIGQNLFYQYDVAYDLQNGIVAFRPVPEASTATFMAVALLMVIGFAFFRTLAAKRRPKRLSLRAIKPR